ncbi:MAG: HAD-IIB family hydrolase [Pseudomonadota bacterium]
MTATSEHAYETSTPTHPIASKPFTLATDLDGTFLGGDETARRRLYDWIESNRRTVGLIFVTGRDPAFIKTLCAEDGVPWPEFVIGDVETTIADVTTDREIKPIAALEAEIKHLWSDGAERITMALADASGLTPQETEFRYRLSYHIDVDTVDRGAVQRVEALGYDVLLSDDRFFDVLPRGVSKGPSLLRLLAHLGMSTERVLAAGDTLNDLSMLTCGVPAVAVGNSEKALLAELDGDGRVLQAVDHGAAGIMEAVSALDLHPV